MESWILVVIIVFSVYFGIGLCYLGIFCLCSQGGLIAYLICEDDYYYESPMARRGNRKFLTCCCVFSANSFVSFLCLFCHPLCYCLCCLEYVLIGGISVYFETQYLDNKTYVETGYEKDRKMLEYKKEKKAKYTFMVPSRLMTTGLRNHSGSAHNSSVHHFVIPKRKLVLTRTQGKINIYDFGGPVKRHWSVKCGSQGSYSPGVFVLNEKFIMIKKYKGFSKEKNRSMYCAKICDYSDEANVKVVLEIPDFRGNQIQPINSKYFSVRASEYLQANDGYNNSYQYSHTFYDMENSFKEAFVQKDMVRSSNSLGFPSHFVSLLSKRAMKNNAQYTVDSLVIIDMNTLKKKIVDLPKSEVSRGSHGSIRAFSKTVVVYQTQSSFKFVDIEKGVLKNEYTVPGNSHINSVFMRCGAPEGRESCAFMINGKPQNPKLNPLGFGRAHPRTRTVYVSDAKDYEVVCTLGIGREYMLGYVGDHLLFSETVNIPRLELEELRKKSKKRYHPGYYHHIKVYDLKKKKFGKPIKFDRSPVCEYLNETQVLVHIKYMDHIYVLNLPSNTVKLVYNSRFDIISRFDNSNVLISGGKRVFLWKISFLREIRIYFTMCWTTMELPLDILRYVIIPFIGHDIGNSEDGADYDAWNTILRT